MANKTLSAAEAAERIGVDTSSVYRWVRDDLFPAAAAYGTRGQLWTERQIVEFIESRELVKDVAREARRLSRVRRLDPLFKDFARAFRRILVCDAYPLPGRAKLARLAMDFDWHHGLLPAEARRKYPAIKKHIRELEFFEKEWTRLGTKLN